MTGLLATKPRPIDVPALAEAALWQELELTPKPGLVDTLNSGSHRDMDHALFVRSITAITPWFARFAELGEAHADKPAAQQLRIIRPMGMACEQAMYAATDGINTHKGGIFALGLLCFAAGRVKNVSAGSLCCEVVGWWRVNSPGAAGRQRRASGSFSGTVSPARAARQKAASARCVTR